MLCWRVRNKLGCNYGSSISGAVLAPLIILGIDLIANRYLTGWNTSPQASVLMDSGYMYRMKDTVFELMIELFSVFRAERDLNGHFVQSVLLKMRKWALEKLQLPVLILCSPKKVLPIVTTPKSWNKSNQHVCGLTWALIPGTSDVKVPAHNTGDLCLISGLGRSPGEGKCLPTPVVLPGEFHGRGSLACSSLWGQTCL